VGTRQQSIDSRIQKSEDEQIRLREIESQNLDADLASVISELTHRQAALQASIQLMGQTARMTLFDYL
jgi:flagellar hook-associated protein 3 FlgL